MTSTPDRASARQFYYRFLVELWGSEPARRALLAAELVTDDFAIRRGGHDDPARGPKALLALVEQSAALFDDIDVRIDQGPIADGDMVAARWTFTGSYRGGLPGARAPEGTRVAFSGLDLVRLSDGRAAEYWVSSDADHLMRQLQVQG